MHNKTTVTLLVICTLVSSNWVSASIDNQAAPAHFGVAAGAPLTVQNPDSGSILEAPALLVAQVGNLLRDTIRRQIRQRLETGEFEDSELGDDDGDIGDDVTGGNENENSSPDDDSQDNEGGTGQDNGDDGGQDNSDDISQDNEPSDDDSGGSGNSGPGSSRINRGPRGSFDNQF